MNVVIPPPRPTVRLSARTVSFLSMRARIMISVSLAACAETTPCATLLGPNAAAASTVAETSAGGRLVGAEPRTNQSGRPESARSRRESRSASIALPRDSRPETVPIGQPSSRPACLWVLPSSSQRMIGSR